MSLTSVIVVLSLCLLQGSEIFAYYTVDWTDMQPSGNVPIARQQLSGIRAQKGSTDCFFIFGGINNWDSADGMLNDIHCYDIAGNVWVDLKGAGTPPSPRRRHSMVAIGQFLYVFGGIDTTNGPVNSLGKYDIVNDKWVSVSPSGSIPAARQGHTAVALNGKMIVFGGQGTSSFFNNMYSFDPDKNTWSIVQTNGQIPGGRSLMSAVTVGTDMYIFGGIKGYGGYSYYLDDLFKFDTVKAVWSQILIGGAPTPRAHHSSVVLSKGNFVTIIGGYSKWMLSDVYFYDIAANEWLMVEPDGEVPVGREAFAATALDNIKVLLYGGYDGYWPGTRDETYMLDIGSTANKTIVKM